MSCPFIVPVQGECALFFLLSGSGHYTKDLSIGIME